MKLTRIAVVSTDGINVDDHFGKASRFLIYDLDDQMRWIEERPTEALSVEDPDHPFDPEKFFRIATLLKDCCKVYVTRIGEVPAAKLKELGVEPVIYNGAIVDIGK